MTGVAPAAIGGSDSGSVCAQRGTSMSIIEWQKDESIAVLVMNNGENRHNLTFVQSMLDTLADIEADPAINGLVITSSDPKIWSLGIELDWMTQRFAQQDFAAIKEFLYGMNRVFKTFLTYPMPVVAAINGHAAANGLIMASACDYRLMRSDRGFCRLPEVDLGIPFLPGMVAVLNKAIPTPLLQDMQYTGRKVTGQELAAHHVVARTFEGAEALMAGSLEFTRSFQKRRGIFKALKNGMNGRIVRIMDEEDPIQIEKLNLFIPD